MSLRKPVPSPFGPPYTDRCKLPKWNIVPTVLMSRDARCARRAFPDWSKQDHAEAARHFAKERDRLSALHARAIKTAEAKYGVSGKVIAGGVSDLFPPRVNDKIRKLAGAAATTGDAVVLHYAATGKRKPFWRSEFARVGR